MPQMPSEGTIRAKAWVEKSDAFTLNLLKHTLGVQVPSLLYGGRVWKATEGMVEILDRNVTLERDRHNARFLSFPLQLASCQILVNVENLGPLPIRKLGQQNMHRYTLRLLPPILHCSFWFPAQTKKDEAYVNKLSFL